MRVSTSVWVWASMSTAHGVVLWSFIWIFAPACIFDAPVAVLFPGVVPSLAVRIDGVVRLAKAGLDPAPSVVTVRRARADIVRVVHRIRRAWSSARVAEVDTTVGRPLGTAGVTTYAATAVERHPSARTRVSAAAGQ